MSTRSFFDFGSEPLEVSEHFSLLSHRVDPGVLGELTNGRDVISVSAECGYLGWSPCISMGDIQYPFAQTLLFRKWRSGLLSEQAHFAYPRNLLRGKVRESEYDSCRLHVLGRIQL